MAREQARGPYCGSTGGCTSSVLASTPYATEEAMLPRTLIDALSELRDDEELRKTLRRRLHRLPSHP
ncbi:MAG: hypothetical protein QF435_05955 [Arenicellales bacterium]|nr:hypothetical protein [Arenicellales bacterium]